MHAALDAGIILFIVALYFTLLTKHAPSYFHKCEENVDKNVKIYINSWLAASFIASWEHFVSNAPKSSLLENCQNDRNTLLFQF